MRKSGAGTEAIFHRIVLLPTGCIDSELLKSINDQKRRMQWSGAPVYGDRDCDFDVTLTNGACSLLGGATLEQLEAQGQQIDRMIGRTDHIGASIHVAERQVGLNTCPRALASIPGPLLR